MGVKILDLGCGEFKLAGKDKFPNYNFEGMVIGLDLKKREGWDVDEEWDLNTGEIPFKNNFFDIVYTNHCLEHLRGVEVLHKIINETHRVLKPKGVFLIKVPYFSNGTGVENPFHNINFGWDSLNYWCESDEHSVQTQTIPKIFKIRRRKILFRKAYKWLGIEFTANKFAGLYTQAISYIFPAREMLWELEKK